MISDNFLVYGTIVLLILTNIAVGNYIRDTDLRLRQLDDKIFRAQIKCTVHQYVE